jgi:hypothetical protein
MLQSLVDKVFLITTVNSERFEYINSHLIQHGIEYHLIISPNYNIIDNDIKVLHSGFDARPSISLLSAYQSIIEKSRLCGYKSIAIVEDDCCFVKNWKELFNVFYKNIPTEWDVLNIGYHPLHDTDSVKVFYNNFAYIPRDWHHTTHCVMIRDTIYDELTRLYNEKNYSIPIDYMFNEIYKNTMYKSFCPIQKIVYQLSIRNSDKYDIPDIQLRFKSSVNL